MRARLLVGLLLLGQWERLMWSIPRKLVALELLRELLRRSYQLWLWWWRVGVGGGGCRKRRKVGRLGCVGVLCHDLIFFPSGCPP